MGVRNNRTPPSPSNVHRIAVVRALQLGDFLTAVPALRALRFAFPESEITMIGLPWLRSIASRFGAYLDRVQDFPGFPGIDEVPYEPERTARFIQAQRRYGYDLALQMHGNGRVSNAFTHALGAPTTVGLTSEPDAAAGLTMTAPYPDGPEVLRNLRVVELVGAAARGTELEFPLFAEDRREAQELLKPVHRRFVIGIHPGARDPARRWEPESFAEVAEALADGLGAAIVLTGTAGEAPTVRDVAGFMGRPALDLAGRSSLGGLAAVVQRLDLLVTNDTGPAHLADALGTASVTIFGPADPRRWASLDQQRHPFVRRPVQPQEVIDVATDLLKRTPSLSLPTRGGNVETL
jgi:ADP-heptose:LPS heptosyltransferase